MVQALMFQLIDFERLDRFANATQQHKYSASKAATVAIRSKSGRSSYQPTSGFSLLSLSR